MISEIEKGYCAMTNFFENNLHRYMTPYKLGKPVLTGSGESGTYNETAVDCPFVFYHRGRFHMLHIGFDGKGYQTGMAVSDDLINWEHKGVVLKREDHVGWDRFGAAGIWIVKESDDIWTLPTLKKIDGRYWMIYHSYPDEGYEAGAAKIGLAWSDDEELLIWHRLKEPVFSWEGGADWEDGGLYKSSVIQSDGRYYMFYNAKNKASNWIEQTGMAFSDDLLSWRRFEGNPVIKVTESAWDSKFCSDPCVVRDGDKWLMFYFGFNGMHAQEGIAVSEDLMNWEKYDKPILEYGIEGSIDELFAHKPSIIFYNNTLYHFYCASRRKTDGDKAVNMGYEFRCISVAASEKF
jgi:Beta-fructosidases (levanase/invertase)